MQPFINPSEADRFKSTNGAWNALRLNDPWSVGYVTDIINHRSFAHGEEWQTHYYKSGQERNKQIETCPEEIQSYLRDYRFKITRPTLYERMDPAYRKFNFNYGRTEEQLREKGRLLQRKMREEGVQMTDQECFNCVHFRVIGETWNGMLREWHTVQTLRKHFPEAEFRPTQGIFDHLYAVDYELYFQGNLVVGIQIKPDSYRKSESEYLLKARAANTRKNQLYYWKFGKPVGYVYSTRDGELLNPEVIQQFQKLLLSVDQKF